MADRRDVLQGLAAAAVGVMIAGCSGDGADRDDELSVAPAGESLADGSVRYEYGDGASQYALLSIPDGTGPFPVVVLIHGGFWRTGFGIDLMTPLVPSLLVAGFAVWNLEYRRVGDGPEGGGGWTGTFDDVAAATDLLASLPADARDRLDLARVATVGHSAGGHLAAWLASRTRLPDESPWAGPAVVPVVAVPQAGVLDLARCIADGVGNGACEDLLGNAELDPRIASASPAALLPIDADVVAIHGDLDRIVPPNQSEGYVDAAVAAGVDASLVLIEGADHFAHIDARHPAWIAVLDALETRV